MHHLVGDFTEVLAGTHIAYPDRPSPADARERLAVKAEDSVMALVRTTRGALGHIGATKIATGAEDELRFEIHGSRGALRFNSMDPHHLDAYDGTAGSDPVGGRRGWTRIDTGSRYPGALSFPGPKFSPGWIRSHVACLANFLRDVADGKPGAPGLAQGIHVQRLIECCRVAAAERRWVDVRPR